MCIVDRPRLVILLTTVLLSSLGGLAAAMVVTALAGLLLPADLGTGARVAILTVAGYAAWGVAALAISAAWLRWRSRTR